MKIGKTKQRHRQRRSVIDSNAFLDKVARRHQAVIAHRPLLNTLQRKPALLGRTDDSNGGVARGALLAGERQIIFRVCSH